MDVNDLTRGELLAALAQTIEERDVFEQQRNDALATSGQYRRERDDAVVFTWRVINVLGIVQDETEAERLKVMPVDEVQDGIIVVLDSLLRERDSWRRLATQRADTIIHAKKAAREGGNHYTYTLPRVRKVLDDSDVTGEASS